MKLGTKKIYCLFICTLLFFTLNTTFFLNSESIKIRKIHIDYPLTIIDDLNRSITFESPPKSVISLSPSTTELLFSIGLTNETIVGVDSYSNYPEEVNTIENIISIWPSINLELIISLEPDLIVAGDIIAKEDITELENRNIKTFILAPSTLFGILENFKSLGMIFDCYTAIEAKYSELKTQTVNITEITSNYQSNPKIYIEYYPYWSYGPNTIGNDIINRSGGINICGSLSIPFAEVNNEFVIGKNPDIIFYTRGQHTVTNKETITNRTGWKSINAVKKGYIFPLDDDSLSRPSLRSFEILKQVHTKVRYYRNAIHSTTQNSYQTFSFQWFYVLISCVLIIAFKKKY